MSPVNTPHQDFVAVVHEGGFRAGPSANFGGWAMLSSMITTGLALSDLQDGAQLDMAMRNLNDEDTPQVGRLRLAGTVKKGRWQITEASPRTDAATLTDALAFTREIFYDDRIVVRGNEEREVMMQALEKMSYLFEKSKPPTWNGDVLSFARSVAEAPGKTKPSRMTLATLD